MKTMLGSSLLLFMASMANADLTLNYGVGIAHSAKYSAFETKMFSAGIKNDLYGPFIEKYDLGLWADQIGEGRKSSGFASYNLGIKVEPSILYMESSWGVGAVTNRDTYLGGNFPQFFQDLYAGVQDNRKTKMGLNYRHISSAGLYKPNRGRDFVTVRIEVGF